ncbi:MAG TPA: hypothetical protein VK171_00025 [Fimbriimonas sp.]|nr:hypothetical protein [Fimbriimonas sp.]
MTKVTFICALGFVLAGFSQAQMLTSRTSTQTYTYVYGAGGDSHTDNFSEVDTTLVNSDGMFNDFNGSTSGVLPGGTPYSTEVWVDLAQAYSITGPLSSFESIIVESNSSAQAANFNGTSQMMTTNPGNGLIFEFTVSSPLDYRFSGGITSSPSEVGAGNFIALQRWDGIVWQQVHNSLFLPGQQGSFDYNGTLSSGQYRLTSANALVAFDNEAVTSVYSYEFQAVPEPLTMLALAPGLAYLARKRKKS